MSADVRVPEAAVYRLSLYHCYLGDLLRTADGEHRITSRRLADALELREETVRRDISFVGWIGRPGTGYLPRELFEALGDFLGLSREHPVVRIGSANVLEALEALLPPDGHGLRAVAYYSERARDAGTMIGDVEVRRLAELPELNHGRDVPVRVALVACVPTWTQHVVDLLADSGVTGALLLTPVLGLACPEGMTIRQVRMPCDIKTIARACKVPVEAR